MTINTISMRSVCWLCTLIILLIGCTSQPDVEVPEEYADLDNLKALPADQEPESDITFTLEATFGDSEEAPFGRVFSGLEVDGQGRIYVGDGLEFTIRVYDSEGTHLRDIGRRGEGPGEFQRIHALRVAGGNLHVLDYNQRRITVFDLSTFEVADEFNVALEEDSENPPPWMERTRDRGLRYGAGDFYVLPRGNYLALFYDEAVVKGDNLDDRTYEASIFDIAEENYTGHGLISFPWRGQLIFERQDRGIRVLHDVPYEYNTVYDYSNGTFVVAGTEEMLFKFYNANAAYQKAWFFPVPKRELTLDDALALYSSEIGKEMVRGDERPATWPQFSDILIDDRNRLWISLLTENPDEEEVWVLDSEGSLRASFPWPSNESLEAVKDGQLYTSRRDTATGGWQFSRYRISM